MPTDEVPRQKKAGVAAGKLRLDRGEVEEVAVDDLAQLRVRHPARPSIDDHDLLDVGVVEALEENAFADHARRARDDCPDSRGFHGPDARRTGGRFKVIAPRGRPVWEKGSPARRRALTDIRPSARAPGPIA
jgi:hypothetical protein